MPQFIQAIFEGGVFRPLEPVQLAEHRQVSLTVTESPSADQQTKCTGDETALERQREALTELRAEMDRLPDCAPVDGLGGADHDQILYGASR